jgi:hypothetical protein
MVWFRFRKRISTSNNGFQKCLINKIVKKSQRFQKWNAKRNIKRYVMEMDEAKSDSSGELSWTKDIEDMLDNILQNTNELSMHHCTRYLKIKKRLTWYKIPVLVMSGVNSVFSVALTLYVSQQITSVVNCLMSLSCAIITSIEMYLGLTKKLELELSSFQGYRLLGIKISALLKLQRANREVDGMPFLNGIISEYKALFEQSNVNHNVFHDRLTEPINPIIKEEFIL